jgi:hypothetical protein
VRIIGIDVGPAKGGHIYEGGDTVFSKCPKCLSEFIKGINNDVLIAWDAPLTACIDPDGWLVESDLTRRVIEAFFSTGKYKALKGVSVLPYSGCPHWTISRRIFGLPRIGQYDTVELPFTLIVRNDDRPQTGRNIVEVHPALALWRWLSNEHPRSSWIYKKNTKACGEIWKLLREKFESELPLDLTFARGEDPNDDELDAVSAWLLARRWLFEPDVSLIGDDQTGALLLPSDADLQQKFQLFRDRELKRRQGVACHCG